MYTSNQVKHKFRHIRQPLERFLDLRDTSETIIDSLKASDVKNKFFRYSEGFDILY